MSELSKIVSDDDAKNYIEEFLNKSEESQNGPEKPTIKQETGPLNIKSENNSDIKFTKTAQPLNMQADSSRYTISDRPMPRARVGYQDINLSNLPLGEMYHPNTRIEFRAANLEEIQHYSTIENDNSYDVRNKIDDILESCLNITLSNGMRGSFLDLKVGDRLFVLLMIRELTFQKGRVLSKPVKCGNEKCGTKFEIEIMRQNIEFHPRDEKPWKWWNPENQTFDFFTTLRENPFQITIPTIGTQRAFLDWIQESRHHGKKINEAFIKIGPYIMGPRSNLQTNELTEMNAEFVKNLNEENFQFLNSVVNKFKTGEFKLGIKGLIKKCPRCGQEVRANNPFPNRASDFFVLPDAFGAYIK